MHTCNKNQAIVKFRESKLHLRFINYFIIHFKINYYINYCFLSRVILPTFYYYILLLVNPHY
jgi:hypothetical protein